MFKHFIFFFQKEVVFIGLFQESLPHFSLTLITLYNKHFSFRSSSRTLEIQNSTGIRSSGHLARISFKCHHSYRSSAQSAALKTSFSLSENKHKILGQTHDSVTKSMSCSCRGHEMDSQHPYWVVPTACKSSTMLLTSWALALKHIPPHRHTCTYMLKMNRNKIQFTVLTIF